MGKKREPSIDDALMTLKDVIKRASISDYQFVNRNAQCKTKKDISLIMTFDQSLWNMMMEDKEIQPLFREIDINNEDDRIVEDTLKYADDLDEGWIKLDEERLFNGEMFEIEIPGFNYKIPINKSIFPIRFKKAEFNNFAYKLYKDDLILSIKKKFEGTVDDSSFTVLRVFHII